MSKDSFRKGLAVGMLLADGAGTVISKEIDTNGTFVARDEQGHPDGYFRAVVSLYIYDKELEEALAKIAELEAENAELQAKVEECEQAFEAVSEALEPYLTPAQMPEDCEDVVRIIPIIFDLGKASYHPT